MKETAQNNFFPVLSRMLAVTVVLGLLLGVSALLGVSIGSSGFNFNELIASMTGRSDPGALSSAIVWQIRLPRVLLAAVVGSTLALGGLVFQALLRNPLAEPYILGISGGSAVRRRFAQCANPDIRSTGSFLANAGKTGSLRR